MLRIRDISTFDVLGLTAGLAFGVVVALDLAELRWRNTEATLEVDPAALAEGFREGVEWHAIYDDAHKIGYSRLERRRLDDGFELSSHTRLRGAGEMARSDIDVTTVLGPAFELDRFHAEVDAGLGRLEADGRMGEGVLVVDVTGTLLGEQGKHLELPVERPTFDFSLRPLVMRADLEPGQRFSFESFDPTSLSARETTIEYLGRDQVTVMGELVDAHWLRQEIAGQVLESWVNDLGEVLREELPGGLTAVRETEAEATWGIDDVTEAEAAGEAAP